MDLSVIAMGIAVFFCRIVDVSLGTIRTISTVQGQTALAFFLGLVEVAIWVTVVSTVVLNVRSSPILVFFYASGFATGNAVGIMVERKMAFGFLILRVISRTAGGSIARRLREQGQSVTTFVGEGLKGPVTELYVVCRRRDMKRLLAVALEEDPEAFYITEQARDVRKVLQPHARPITGWRAILKKK